MIKFVDLKNFIEKNFNRFTKYYYKKIEDTSENYDEDKSIIYRGYGEKTLETVVFEEINIKQNKKEIENLLGIFIDEQIPEHPLNEMLISSVKSITEERDFDFVEEIYNLIVFIYYVSVVHKDKFISEELSYFLHKLFYFFIDINKITYMEIDKNTAINKIRDFFVYEIKEGVGANTNSEIYIKNNDNDNNNSYKEQTGKRKLFLL